MDNASKALIMAGGILIAVMVISISMYLLEMFRYNYERSSSLVNAYQVNAFNSFFTQYGNNTTISGVDAYNILSKVSEVNAGYETITYHIDSNAGNVNVDNFIETFYFTQDLGNEYHYSYGYNESRSYFFGKN